MAALLDYLRIGVGIIVWAVTMAAMTLLGVYVIAWVGMHVLDQPDIFWVVNGVVRPGQ
jgi:hypothetical protein